MRPLFKTAAALSLLFVLVPAPSIAESPEELKRRLEAYRQIEEEAALKQAQREAEAVRLKAMRDREAALQRQQTLEWQARRRREEYARRWSCYDKEEIDVIQWRQEKDGSWITRFKDVEPESDCTVVFTSLLDGIERGATNLASPATYSSLPTEMIWVRARKSLTLEQLASEIGEVTSLIKRLNDVDEDHVFSPGDWLVLPARASKNAKRVPAIDTSELRRSAPLSAPLEPQETARIRFGDNLAQVAQRYNLSIQELLKLNPELRAARMVVGTPIRVAKAPSVRSRMLLGLKPLGSGGLSWPDQDDFGFGLSRQSSPSPPRPKFSADQLIAVNCVSLMINRKRSYENWGTWVRPGRQTAEEQMIIDRCAKAVLE